MELESFFTDNPYQLAREPKIRALVTHLSGLTQWHRKRCIPYCRMVDSLPSRSESCTRLEDLPMLPIRLFKLTTLRSIPENQIIKTLTSSGTTSRHLSRVFVDKETAHLQTRALACILKSFLGGKRLPMVLVDTPDILENRTTLTARSAGFMGLSYFGRDYFYLLNTEQEVKWEAFLRYLEKYPDQKLLIFGSTYLIWKNLYLTCKKKGFKVNLKNAVLIHTGGWKKMLEEAVDNSTFKSRFKQQLGLREIYNFYGMVEQVGSIFMECREGVLHAPDFSEVIVRDPHSLEPLETNQTGLLQVMSILPRSYPGHSLLTEDLGTVHGQDDCPCGRMGTYFSIEGRLPAAELRGCSDTLNIQGGIG